MCERIGINILREMELTVNEMTGINISERIGINISERTGMNKRWL